MLGTLFSFKGRTNRLGYLGIGFVQGVVIAGAIIILAVVFKGRQAPVAVLAPTVLVAVALIGVTVWLGLAVMARRLRDMGLPAIPSLVAILAISAAGQFARLGHHGQDALTPMALLFGGVSALIGFALLFWPSAPANGLDDDSSLDDIFGEVAPQPDKPALVKAPSRLAPLFRAKPAPPAQPTVRPAPLPSARDASGRIVPRGQFGLRQSF